VSDEAGTSGSSGRLDGLAQALHVEPAKAVRSDVAFEPLDTARNARFLTIFSTDWLLQACIDSAAPGGAGRRDDVQLLGLDRDALYQLMSAHSPLCGADPHPLPAPRAKGQRE
jgi:hypothetical protein